MPMIKIDYKSIQNEAAPSWVLLLRAEMSSPWWKKHLTHIVSRCRLTAAAAAWPLLCLWTNWPDVLCEDKNSIREVVMQDGVCYDDFFISSSLEKMTTSKRKKKKNKCEAWKCLRRCLGPLVLTANHLLKKTSRTRGFFMRKCKVWTDQCFAEMYFAAIFLPNERVYKSIGPSKTACRG